jgi:nucleotide-binding universal stress UspA family protein
MKILIAYDGSTFADVAVDGLQSAGLPEKAEALIVSVVEPDRYVMDAFGSFETVSRDWTKRIEAATQSAESLANRLQNYFPAWDVRVETPSGHPAALILDRAEIWPADLIVMGTHGRSGIGRVVLGSVSFKVVRHAPCSVRIGRASVRQPGEAIRILIGDDGSPEAQAAVNAVCRRSWPAGAQVRVVTAPPTLAPVDPKSYALAAHSVMASEAFLKTDREERHRSEDMLESAAKQLENAGLHVTPIVEDGNPIDVLLHECKTWHPESIFLGACGLGRVERLLLGSISEALVTRGPCTVEVVRDR